MKDSREMKKTPHSTKEKEPLMIPEVEEMQHVGVVQAQMAMGARTLTFASMLHEAVDVWRRRDVGFQLPDWAIERLSDRKDQATLTENEQQRFLCALNVLIANGTFGSLVDIHADMTHQMHGTQRFLPWHRVYLRQFELALQSNHPDVTLPYWDWTQPGEESVPGWLVAFTPTIITPTQTIPVTRSPGTASDLAGIASNVPSIMSQSAFATFTSQLEGIVHNSIHVWVGGSMSSVPTAPADPLFWMHHANIDRLWWVWQNSSAGTGQNPSLSGSAAIMDPWPTTEAQTRDITAMGYTYP